MSLHTTHETVLRRKQTHLAPFQTDSYMSERDLRSRSDLKKVKLTGCHNKQSISKMFTNDIKVFIAIAFHELNYLHDHMRQVNETRPDYQPAGCSG